VLILLIAARLVSWRVGLVAGLLSALEPHMGFASNLVLPDALSALPLLLALFVLTRVPAGAPRAWWSAALAGAILGAGVWLRPNVVLAAPFLAVVLVVIARARRRALGEAVLMTAAAAAMVLPITIRNYVIFREFVPVSLNGGLTVWQGVTDAGGLAYGARKRDMLVAEEEAQRYGKPSYRHWWAEPDGIWRDRERYRRAREVIAAHPVAYAALMLKRMAGMIDYGDGFAPYLGDAEAPVAPEAPAAEDDGDSASVTIARRPSDDRYLALGRALAFLRAPLRLVQSAFTPALTGLVVLGAALLVAARPRPAALVLAVPVYYLLTESCFLLEWRVVVPMHYGLFVGAAAVLVAAGALAARGVAAVRRVRTDPAPAARR
jgi:hypothetical protein